MHLHGRTEENHGKGTSWSMCRYFGLRKYGKDALSTLPRRLVSCLRNGTCVLLILPAHCDEQHKFRHNIPSQYAGASTQYENFPYLETSFGVTYRALVGKCEGRNHLEDTGVDGRIILRWIFRKSMEGGGHGLD